MEDQKGSNCLNIIGRSCYRSLVVASNELVWLKSLLASLGIFHKQLMHLFCDSQVAIHIAKNPIVHERTKHIEIIGHFVCEKLEYGDMIISYLSTEQQPTDIFAKALGKKQFIYLTSKLCMITPRAPP